MSVCKNIAILLSFLVAANVSEAGSYNSMLEAQFLNVTQDIKIGAAELDANVEDFGIVEVSLNLIYLQQTHWVLTLVKGWQLEA